MLHTQHTWIGFSILALTVAAHAADKADDKPKELKDFLVDTGLGAVSAAEVLGVSSSAVTTIQTAKDLILVLNSNNSDTGKSGFGVSFTPARTALAPVAIADYADNKGLSRLWGNTTFSYAQNTKAVSGVDHKQDAIAVHVSYYWDPEADPIVRNYLAFAGCKERWKEIYDEADLDQKAIDTELARQNAIRVKQGKPKLEILSVPDSEAAIRERKADATYSRAHQLGLACVKAGNEDAKKYWNATQLALVAGEGWIKAPTAGASSLSLGRSIAMTAAYGPNANSLLNLTYRYVSDELDLTSLATTPVYKSSSVVAARYTVGHGADQGLYSLFEVSNANAASGTTSNSAFKYAIGIDKLITEGAWLEFRLGRNQTFDGSQEQTTALFNLRFSPKSTLPKL